MLRYFLFIALLSSCLHAAAQQQKSVSKDSVSLLQRMRNKVKEFTSFEVNNPTDSLPTLKLDSIKLNLNDSLRLLAIDSLKDFKPQANGDSLRSVVNAQSEKLKEGVNATSGKLTNLSDSIQQKVNERVEGFQERLNSATSGFQSKSDTLQRKATEKVTGLETKASEKLNKLSGKDVSINEKLPVTGIETQLPKVDLPNVNVTTELPVGSVPNADVQLPKSEINSKAIVPNLPQLPSVRLPENVERVTDKLNTLDSKAKELQGYGQEVKEFKENSTEKLKELQDSEQAKELLEKNENLNLIKTETDKYTEQLKDLKGKDFSDIDTKALEDELAEVSGVKDLDMQAKKLKELQAVQSGMITRYADKKLIIQELKRKTANVANDQISSFMPSIQSGQQKIKTVKKVAGQSGVLADSVKKLKRSNEMSERPFIERVVPGISIQVFSGKEEALFDFGPQLGFRFTGWLTAGVGGIYRVSAGKTNKYWVDEKGVYGYRLYMDYGLVRGLFIHAEYERLNFNRPVLTLSDNYITSSSGVNLGIGKKYTISKHVKGSLLGLYHINIDEKLPGQNKFLIRMVFDYRFKKK